MSKSATGSVVDQENGTGIAGLNVDIEDVSQLHDGRVLNQDPVVTDASGNFNLSYASYAFNTTKPGAQARQLRLTIRLGRLVLKQVFRNEGAFGDTVVFDAIALARAEAKSWRPTLGTGKETRVSTGNAIRWLADNVDAWSRAAQVITKASTLDIMQLTISVGDFKQDNPIVVMDFDSTDNTSGDNFVILRTDDRIEQTLLTAATKQPVPADVRIQIPRMSLDPNIIRDSAVVLTGGAVLLALGAGGLFLLGGIVLTMLGVLVGVIAVALAIAAYLVPSMPQYFGDWYRKKFEELDLEKWFKDAAASGKDSSHVRVRQLVYRSFNIAHAKVVLDRGKEAVLLGSPFEQVYFDAPDHAVVSGRRGVAASKGPIHDVSAGVRGPALKDFQGLFNSHWKIADPTETLPDPAAPAAATAGDGEFNSTVQLILTLDRMFSGAGQNDGEKGILEAYLRAIHFAKRFIYIENQYFHNPVIVQALIDALTANSDLVVILMLNISPDMPYYLRWQRRGIQRIANALTAKYGKDGVKPRFRVFSSFSHAAPDTSQAKPRLIDNYLHTKTAIIDNVWATVGSANLDGASLDAEDYFRSAVDGEVRHTEANVLVYEDTPVAASAVDALRRRLWAEHLGIVVNNQPGVLDVKSQDLNDSPTKNWLDFWSQKADAKLNGLKGDPHAVSLIHILPVDFDYGPDADGKGRIATFLANTKGAMADHYALESYLDHMFRQDSPPKRTVADFDLDAPPNFPFKYLL